MGAKTVNGPPDATVERRLVASSAVTSVLKLPAASAVATRSTMVGSATGLLPSSSSQAAVPRRVPVSISVAANLFSFMNLFLSL